MEERKLYLYPRPYIYKKYRFTRNIVWYYKRCGGYTKLDPSLSYDYWEECVAKNKFNVICPGYFLETLLCIFLKRMLSIKGIKINKWIIPKFYDSMLNFFKIKSSCKEINLFKEFTRLHSLLKDYPTPLFFDRDENIYFNMLYDYGTIKNNSKYIRNTDPFWKQFFDNLGFDYTIIYPSIDIDRLKQIVATNFNHNGFNANKGFVVIDSSNLSYKTADNRMSKNRIFAQEEIRDIASYLRRFDLQCVVMSDNKTLFQYSGAFIINSWINLDPLAFMSLLRTAKSVISSDQNLYLSAAILGNNNIISIDNPPKGFSLDDIGEFTLCEGERRWLTLLDFNCSDIGKAIGDKQCIQH